MMSEIIGFEKKHRLRPKQKFQIMINTIKKTDIKYDKVLLVKVSVTCSIQFDHIS